MSPSRWQVAEYDVSESNEELLTARLWAAGSAGSWSPWRRDGRARIEAYFDQSAPSRDELTAIGADSDARFLGLSAAMERDWLSEWRAAAGPIAAGDRFVIDPREPAEVVEPFGADARVLLRLPARTAFGVGSHESTRLAIELLERSSITGARVLDVGAGTGVLSFAALALGARSVVAFDLDSSAALPLPQMMALNGMRFLSFAGTARALSGAARFDLALVNVVPAEIEDDLDRLAAAIVPGGRAIFSGILVEQGDAALARLERAGFVERERRTAGEWIAFATAKVEREA